MARKRATAVQDEPKVLKAVLILPDCTCTYKTYPHSHAEDNGDVPWNTEKTRAIWDKQKKLAPRVRVVNGELQVV